MRELAETATSTSFRMLWAFSNMTFVFILLIGGLIGGGNTF